jgi:hypothetical protein
MKTQELKSYIDRVLGNNIRCLLPSYWWKKLFHSVADRIDEVEQTTSQLIDSKVEEVKMPIVESVDELSKLNLPKGGVASVEKVGEPVVVNLEDCYLSADAATDWDKYTIIRGSGEKGAPSNAVGQIHLYSDKSMENGLTISCGEGKYFYYKIVNGRRYYSSLEEVNEYLASGEYRLVFGYYIENVSAYVTLYSQFPQPSLYIKGDSWDKLANEYVVSSEEELNALSVENGTIAKVAKWQYGEVDPYQCYSITNESSHDDDTIKRIWDKLTRISHIDITYPETPPTVMPAWPTILLHGYASTSDDVIQITYYQESYKIGVGNSGSTNIVSIDKINTILQEKDYRLINLTNDEYARPFIEEHITFYSPNANITADAYIKGETWTRLLKEGDVTGGSHEAVLFYMPMNNGLSEKQKQTNAESYRKVVEGFNNNRYYDVKVDCVYCIADATIVANALLTEGRIALMFDMLNTWQVMEVLEDGSATVEEEVAGKGCEIREFYIGDSLTDEQKAWNLETAQAILDKKAIVIYNGSILGDGITTNNDGSKEFINSVPTPQGVLYAGVKVEEDGTASVFLRQLYLDDKLSDKSINAVQNKVVTEALGILEEHLAVHSKQISSLGLSMATKTDVDNAIANAITTTLNTAV